MLRNSSQITVIGNLRNVVLSQSLLPLSFLVAVPYFVYSGYFCYCGSLVDTIMLMSSDIHSVSLRQISHYVTQVIISFVCTFVTHHIQIENKDHVAPLR